MSSPIVTVSLESGTYVVRIEEVNGELHASEFTLLQHAENFAAGQRKRLGLPTDSVPPAELSLLQE